ncbi:TIGR01621 family pseudouridine synthase [Pokkaliibacter sp. CJK22405]|uniref:TIGR01621 family pseudouridine synthase n=1 Tax=Pokkaliibacter sp. CJK22405 TaxID=3384615 RepID=UPI003985218A
MYHLLVDTQDFLLVNKCPGINFHSEDEAGLAAAIKADLKLDSLYPVHRLDKVTSGLVLFGKTLEFTQSIGIQFETHQIKKLYVALSDKRPSKKQGWIKGDMVKARRGAWKLTPTMKHPAITQFSSINVRAGLRSFFLFPHTGKTHQLRVAMKSLAAPIIGDPLYNAQNAVNTDRAYLHAAALQFRWGGKPHAFVLWPEEGQLFNTIPWQQLVISNHQPWMNWVLEASELKLPCTQAA